MQNRMFGKFCALFLAAVLAACAAGCGSSSMNLSLSDDILYAATGADRALDPGPEGPTEDVSVVETAAGMAGTVAAGESGNTPADPKKPRSWGLLRKNDHTAPDIDPGAGEILARYGALYISDTTDKKVWLTFDEGYENGYTPSILNTLKRLDVKAIFFITGPYLKSHLDLVKRMLDEGHSVGNHTLHHPSLPSISDKEVEEEAAGLDRLFREAFGTRMVFFRPPMGEYSEHTLAILQRMGYTTLFWSFAYDDWHRDRTRGIEYARDIIKKNIHNGAILLLHAVSGDNAGALPYVIADLKAQGYSFGSPEELLKK